MGRALKIQKNNVGAGTSVSGSNPVVTTYNQTVLADAGFPNFGSLTNPAFNTPVQTLGNTQFLGVVGGSPATSTASATFPEVAALVNILLVNGSDSQTATSSYTGRLIRQKGSHKFLVAATGAAIADESFLVGQAYQVSTVGTTDWAAVGAGTGVAVGDIFTATAAGSGTGEAYIVGQCVLSNTATPTAGNMSIQYSTGDSSAVFASYITNKWVRDWTGMTYGNYSNSNFGENIQSGENQYVANFFTDEGNVTVSGGELSGTTSVDNPTIQLAQIASVTS
jgi:hypothetical protein